MNFMQKVQQMSIKKKVLLIHGPNIQIKSDRDTGVNSKEDLQDLNTYILEQAEQIGVECKCYSSNVEGAIVTKIQKARENYQGIILNAGSYRYYSLAIRDAISAVKLPTVEVHTGNYARTKAQDNPNNSVIASVCVGQILGFGAHSYILAVDALAEII